MQQGCVFSVVLHAARYQDYQAKQIPVVTEGGATVRVMAGEARGAAGPIALRNPGLLLDVNLAPHAAFHQEVCNPNGVSCRPPQQEAVMRSQGASGRTLRTGLTDSLHVLAMKVLQNALRKFMSSAVSMHVLVMAVPDRLQRQVNPEWNGFVYVCDGSGTVSGVKAAREQVKRENFVHFQRLMHAMAAGSC